MFCREIWEGFENISSFDDVIFVLTKRAWHSFEAAAVPESNKEWTVSWEY
jgi:hypothetical protein